jgi:hypothetical protein
MSADLSTTPDRELSESLFYLDARCAEHWETDAVYGSEDGPDDAVAADFEARAQVRAELARREAAGITIEDPNAETFGQRYEPFGTAWQEEQRDRMDGR